VGFDACETLRTFLACNSLLMIQKSLKNDNCVITYFGGKNDSNLYLRQCSRLLHSLDIVRLLT
jgi:hypothetical protein